MSVTARNEALWNAPDPEFPAIPKRKLIEHRRAIAHLAARLLPVAVIQRDLLDVAVDAALNSSGSRRPAVDEVVP